MTHFNPHKVACAYIQILSNFKYEAPNIDYEADPTSATIRYYVQCFGKSHKQWLSINSLAKLNGKGILSSINSSGNC